MPPKAYRWVAEMQEIAGFVADDPAARELYEGAAEFYERFAEDFERRQEGRRGAADFWKSAATDSCRIHRRVGKIAAPDWPRRHRIDAILPARLGPRGGCLPIEPPSGKAKYSLRQENDGGDENKAEWN